MPWRTWGPYLSERQWGTVREDYSDNGDAWSYFSHDQARSRAYRWGEDGLAGISDDKQRLCLALALWNERDPILKERLFGLTNSEGNHGEDVKEYYFYLDNLADAQLSALALQVPAAEFPYGELVRGEPRRARGTSSSTSCSIPGVFDEDRYFDVEVEHAKAAPDDILLPHHGAQPSAARTPRCTCCRRSGSATPGRGGRVRPKPRLLPRRCRPHPVIRAEHAELGVYYLHAEAGARPAVLRERDECGPLVGLPSARRAFPRTDRRPRRCTARDTVNPDAGGTKAAAHVRLEVPAGGQAEVLVRLTPRGTRSSRAPFAGAGELIARGGPRPTSSTTRSRRRP